MLLLSQSFLRQGPHFMFSFVCLLFYTLYLPLHNIEHTSSSHFHPFSPHDQTNTISLFSAFHWYSQSLHPLHQAVFSMCQPLSIIILESSIFIHLASYVCRKNPSMSGGFTQSNFFLLTSASRQKFYVLLADTLHSPSHGFIIHTLSLHFPSALTLHIDSPSCFTYKNITHKSHRKVGDFNRKL